jgi:hypothetical protein
MANNEATYLKLRSIRLGQGIVRVSNFTLKREAGTFTFKSGSFHFLESVNGNNWRSFSWRYDLFSGASDRRGAAKSCHFDQRAAL